MKLYGVINMDIVNSRYLANRKVLQEKIHSYINYMNEKYKNVLLASITITLGDEWQIVIKEPHKGYKIISSFQKLLRKDGISVYSGFGIGTISTDMYEDTRIMDGECFIKAREALNIAKNKNRFYNKLINSKKNNVHFNGSDIYFNEMFFNQSFPIEEVAITSGDNVAEQKLTINNIINAMIENNEILKHKITAKQWDIIGLYEKFGSYNNVVKELETTSKADISQKINSSNYFVIKNNNLNISKLLKLYCEIKEGRSNEL
jgi:hypothetical protein